MLQSNSISWSQFNGTQGNTVLSVSEFKEQWLYGIPLCNNVTGQEMSDNVYKRYMLAAQTKVENELGIKLFPTYVTETKDYIQEEFNKWGYIKTSWPILKPCELEGRLNEREIISYPKEWLTIRRESASDNQSFKNLYIVPNGQNNVTFTFLATTYPHYFQVYGARIVPNYWNIKYVSGFHKVPDDIIQLIGMLVSMYVLPQLEMTVGGANSLGFGLASSSLSLDGLSQSTSKMNGGNIFSNRMKSYSDQFKELWVSLKGIYKGITFDVC